MASYCVEFDDTPECKRMERFIKKCPDTQIENPFDKHGKFFNGMPPFGQFGRPHHSPHFKMGGGGGMHHPHEGEEESPPYQSKRRPYSK